MGFIDGLFNAVKSKYERDMSSYRDGYSSGSSKYSSMSDSELMRKARNKDFSGNSSKQIRSRQKLWVTNLKDEA